MGLDHESLDLILQAPDLVHQVAGLVGGDASSDDCSADATGATKGGLGWNVDVGHVLVLTEERQVQEDGQRSGVGSEDDDLGDAAVESLGGLVGALLQLLVVGCLLDDIQDLLGQGCVGRGPGWRGMLAEVRYDGGLGGEVVVVTHQQIRSLRPFFS